MSMTTCLISPRELRRGCCCASMRRTLGGMRVAAAADAIAAAPFKSRRRVRVDLVIRESRLDGWSMMNVTYVQLRKEVRNDYATLLTQRHANIRYRSVS